ncbi:MAG: S8 family peptidase [Lachnospiraceae bacterium]|nr:S8 family peptidase [Lachnospiraceae bacterium]
MERILKDINAIYAYERGITGRGVGVAVLDTGIALHPDLMSRVSYFRDYVDERTEPYDDNGHGTHISGIIGAQSETKLHGVAPACSLLGCKVLDQNGNGKIEHTCQALEDLMEKNRRRRRFVRIVNISVGMTDAVRPGMQSLLISAVEKAWDSGIVVIAAAGNNGPGENTITSPGISRKIITVGSIDDEWNSTRGRGYSGRGPTSECVVKPEILMPGTNILSCSNRKGGYTRKSGTSMAAPVLSGVIALLLSAYPSLTPNEVKMRLFYAAKPVGEERHGKSWGTVRVDALL